MAKNIQIYQGGLLKAFNAPKLKTKNTDGGNTLWIPLDETATATRSINENGTYHAEAQGYYGYSKVIVDVHAQAVGTYDDGNTYAVTVDDDGYLVKRMLPASIRITTPPTKTSYSNGEAIDITGMVVTAYDANGNVWDDESYPNGIIPNSEISIVPTKASSGGQGGGTVINFDPTGLNLEYPGWNNPLMTVQTTFDCHSKRVAAGVEFDYSYVVINETSDVYALLVFGKEVKGSRDTQKENGMIHWLSDGYFEVYNTHSEQVSTPLTRTYDGHTIYCARQGSKLISLELQEAGRYDQVFASPALMNGTPTGSKTNSTSWAVDDLSKIFYYGNVSTSTCTIVANWNRPNDSLVLSDSFEVYVN